jgi:eukaryotic-like serine/threonine-protein kinase
VTPDAGTMIGPYEILSPLGAGGMGQVFRARDRRLRRDVALKFLLERSDPTSSSRLLSEARAASALNHPNICQIYDVGESDHGPWIAMEFVPGGRLDTSIPAAGIPYEIVVRLGIEIASALDHAHERGIIHRDLKPANCVLTTESSIKVLDFGLATSRRPVDSPEFTQTASETREGERFAGTLPYLAPEVLRGEAANERSDLWAFGVLLHEMATGSRPFTGSSAYDLADSILNKPAAPLPDRLPQAFRSIVGRLLEKDPHARYQSASDVRAALETIREIAAPGTASPLPPRWRISRAPIAAGLVLVATLGAAYFWMQRDRSLQLGELELVSTFEGSHAFPAFAPDGGRVAFVAQDSAGIPQIWVKDLGGESPPLQVTFGPTAAERPRWHPRGDVIAFARRREGIWTVPPLGGTPNRIAEQGTNPNYSADGTRLTFEVPDGLVVAAFDGSGPQTVEGVPPRYYSIPRMPALSPDGEHIAFFHPEAGPNGDLYTIPASGGTPRRLTFDVREGGAPVWSPDGARIIFSSARAGSWTLWQIPAEGGDPRPLTSGAGRDDTPDISHDGTRLIFTNVRNNWQLKARALDGEERQLLEKSTELLFPVFSPDGKRIAFFGRATWAVAIFAMARDGSDLLQLTAGRELNHMPRWSADGRDILFYQNQPDHGVKRISAVGGPSVTETGWDWLTHNAFQFDTSGTRIVYTRQSPLGISPSEHVTVIRDSASSTERELPQPHLHFPRFSPDGRSLAGMLHDGQVTVCPVSGGMCSALAKAYRLSPVCWSSDMRRVYFLRQGPGAIHEVWSVGVDGAGEQKHFGLGRFRGIDVFFDLSSLGEVVWAPMTPGRQELWTAKLR